MVERDRHSRPLNKVCAHQRFGNVWKSFSELHPEVTTMDFPKNCVQGLETGLDAAEFVRQGNALLGCHVGLTFVTQALGCAMCLSVDRK